MSGLKAEYAALRAVPRATSGADVHALIERLHRAMRSDRDITITVTRTGELTVNASPTIGPLRQAEEASVWVRLFNDSEQVVPCRVEIGSKRRAYRLPPAGSRSFLHALATDSSATLRVKASTADANGEACLGLEARPSRAIMLRLPEGPARLVVSDDVGPVRPARAAIRRDLHGRWYFHARRQVSLRVSGQVRIEASRGPEFEPLRVVTEPDRGPDELIDVRLSRRIDPSNEGWVSGDLHAHLHYGGEYLLHLRDAALIQEGEGLGFLNLLVANQESDVVHDRSAFTDAPAVHGRRTTAWGQEFRNDFYGHVTLTGLARLIEPVFSGFHGTTHSADYPSTVETAKRSRAEGALVSSAHPVIFGDSISEIFRRPRSVEAKELPVLAALGLVDAVDLLSYPGDAEATARLWYRLLDCGLRIAASAGSDAFMNVADGDAFMAGESGVAPGSGGAFSSPPGGVRVYAQTMRPDRGGICDAIRAGRTFVTNGPFLTLAIDGEPIGSVLRRDRGETLHVEASIATWVPVASLELIVNGRVARRVTVEDPPAERHVEWALPVDGAAWIAVRTRGEPHPEVMDDYAFAHTSATYVDVAGARVARGASFDYFVRWIDRLSVEVTRHCRFDDENEERSVRAAYAMARRYYDEGATR
jgi:hypothetical protein